MKLLSLKYKSLSDEGWKLEELTLNSKINLLVGQNATGKSRTINVISTLNYLLTGFDKEENIPIGIWECVLKKDNNQILKYKIEIIAEEYLAEDSPQLNITERIGASWLIIEKLYLDEKLILSREGDQAEIYSMKKKRNSKISPPFDQLVIQVRRDKIEYPFFEDLILWANGMKEFNFSSVNSNLNKEIEYHDIAKLLSKLPESNKLAIIYSLNEIGYKVEDIKINKMWDGEYYFRLKEKGVTSKIFQSQLSQGLLRAFALIVYIEYSLYFNNIKTITIDDLSEGLDYERATKLGKLLVEKIENSNIQLIATSNDSFLMDVIPIKYWNILHREGNTVKSFNYQNSKERFDKFLMTGLSNFDLFSSDYLMRPKP
jgi:AAA15 family ATPase/GTPase